VSLRSRLLPPVALVAAGLLGLSACGQKSGVAGTEVVASDGGGGGDGQTDGGGGGDTGGGGGGDGSGQAAGEHEPGPNNEQGVTDDEIVIGVHAPVTGASPIAQETFNTGKDIYWQFLAESAPDSLGGRRVRVVFRDDEFNPRRAVQVCREMVEQENAFVLVGGGGADQITACAKYASEAGVPYFSAGVNEEGLTGLDTYYALSLTYAQQAPLIAQRIKDQGLEKVALVVADTPSFQDGHEAFLKAAKDAKLDVVVDDSINKTPAPAESLAEAQKLKNSDAEAVFVLISPVAYIGLAGDAQRQDYTPMWFGPGITSGLNQVVQVGCPGTGNGEFFSPFPELDVINELDPDYLAAYEQFGGGRNADDIGIALWGLNKAIHAAFDAAGDTLGRAEVMNAIEGGVALDTGVYPPVEVTPDDHFGGTGAHLLKADCDRGQYITEEQFVEASSDE
jgi:ABC-type branched-subunit amino acid transport system substrate-binding protein